MIAVTTILNEEQSKSLYVYSEYGLVKALVDDVEYIERMDDCIKIYFTSATPLPTLMTLKNILKRLPPDQFKRTHRSYIVSVPKIKYIY